MNIKASALHFRSATREDWPSIRDLLIASGLPLDGAVEHLADFIIAEQAEKLIGCAGLEIYSNAALLRSCAVDQAYRGNGLGNELVHRTVVLAESRGIHELVLLTTTAEDYFPRFGFERITRDDVADVLKASEEFTGVCPASAHVMRLRAAPK